MRRERRGWAGSDALPWLIGALSFPFGMAGGLWMVSAIGSVARLEAFGLAAYILLIVAIALGGAVGFVIGHQATRWLARRLDFGGRRTGGGAR